MICNLPTGPLIRSIVKVARRHNRSITDHFRGNLASHLESGKVRHQGRIHSDSYVKEDDDG